MDKQKSFIYNVALFGVAMIIFSYTIFISLATKETRAIFITAFTFQFQLLVFIFGYLCRRSKKPTASSLFLQYLVFQTVHALLSLYVFKNTARYSYFTPYWFFWIFFCFAAWRILTPFIDKFQPLRLLAISFIIAVFIGYDRGAGDNFAVSRFFSFTPFFLMGYYCTEEKLDKIKKIPWYVAVIPFIAVLARNYFFPPLKVDSYFFSSTYSSLRHNGIIGGSIRIVLLFVSTMLVISALKFIPRREFFFTRFGKRVISPFVLSSLTILILNHTMHFSFFASYKRCLLLLAVMFLLSVLFLTKPFEKLFSPITNPERLFSWLRRKLFLSYDNSHSSGDSLSEDDSHISTISKGGDMQGGL